MYCVPGELYILGGRRVLLWKLVISEYYKQEQAVNIAFLKNISFL